MLLLSLVTAPAFSLALAFLAGETFLFFSFAPCTPWIVSWFHRGLLPPNRARLRRPDDKDDEENEGERVALPPPNETRLAASAKATTGLLSEGTKIDGKREDEGG